MSGAGAAPVVVAEVREERVIRPEPGSCGFYVQRKKRFCKMSVKPGAQYCGEHSPLPVTEHDLGGSTSGSPTPLLSYSPTPLPGNKPISELRVPCPYDPKHTCFATRMEKHLKICNSKPLAILPPYMVPGINKGDPLPGNIAVLPSPSLSWYFCLLSFSCTLSI